MCVLMLLLACGDPRPPASPAPAARRWASAELSLSAADLVAVCSPGRGPPTPVLAQGQEILWGERRLRVQGTVQRMACGDSDGDGTDELWVGSGLGRQTRDAPAQVWRIDTGDPTLVWEHQGERNQVTELVLTPEGIWLAAFADPRVVEAGWLRQGSLEVVVRTPLALAQRPLPGGGAVVGRMYGDEPRSTGDLAIVDASGERSLRPSLRGVRALATADLDRDGDVEILYSDGWDAAYAQQADPRVGLLDGPTWTDARTVAFLLGNYTITALEARVDAHGPLVLAVGTSTVHVLSPEALGWKDTPVGPVSETGNAVWWEADDGLGVLVAGDPARRLVP